MNDFFGWLTLEQWLAILRIGIGLWWIKSVWHKEYPKFVKSGMISWTNSLLDNHPVPAYAGVIRSIINFQPTVFPYLIVLGELAVGVGLTLGFLTPLSALVALLLNFNYITVSGVKPKDIAVNNCFRVDQGQNFVMIVAEIVIFFAGAGAVWSLDNLLGIFI
jgi:thiosulfate dehydrogenase [quinone] large subunit